MKFLNYLNEGRTEDISQEEAINNIKKYCKKNYKIIKTIPIYRGVTYLKDFGLIDTNKGSLRVSANTKNYVTLLLDNLPSWKDYPKRSRGLICSTDRNYASWYGNLYHIIPFDNSKIGVASEMDIWGSFDKFFSNISNVKYFDIHDFNSELDKWFNMFNIKEPKTYQELKTALISLSNMINTGEKIANINYKFIFGEKDIMKFLNDKMSPEYNGFKKGIKNIKRDREVWIQGKCILVSNLWMNNFKLDI